jgi:hypothetical protein
MIDEVDTKEKPVVEAIASAVTPNVKTKIDTSGGNSADPRDKLSKRLTKFIAKTSKINVEEVERRANRKQKALAVATNWMCLALVAKEQGIQMQEIVDALAIR